MRSRTRRTHLGWQKILDIKTSTLIPLRRANAVADASTAQKARRRKPSRHQMDTKLEGSTLTRSGKGSTTRFVCSPNSFTEAWGSYCSGRLVGVSDASPGSGFCLPTSIHACVHACMHSLIGRCLWSAETHRKYPSLNSC